MSNEKRKKMLVSVEQKIEAMQRLDKDKTAKKWLRLWCWLCYCRWLQAEKLTSVLPEHPCGTLYIKNNAHRSGRVRN